MNPDISFLATSGELDYRYLFVEAGLKVIKEEFIFSEVEEYFRRPLLKKLMGSSLSYDQLKNEFIDYTLSAIM